MPAPLVYLRAYGRSFFISLYFTAMQDIFKKGETMNYTETQQKLILREMERDILAIVAIDLRGDEYEVIYSDGAYKNYKNRYRSKDFFASWEKYGIPQVYEPDRARRLAEISLENLTEKLSSGGDFYTIARL